MIRCPSLLQEDITVPPPPWTPNAYFRLSFTQTGMSPNQDLAGRLPNHSSPLDAIDFTKVRRPFCMHHHRYFEADCSGSPTETNHPVPRSHRNWSPGELARVCAQR